MLYILASLKALTLLFKQRAHITLHWDLGYRKPGLSGTSRALITFSALGRLEGLGQGPYKLPPTFLPWHQATLLLY